MRERERIDPRRIQEGDAVATADGHVLGHVIAFWPDMLEPRFLVVEGGLLIHHDWYVPVETIALYVPGEGHAGRVTLAVTRDEVDGAGWDQPPPGAPPASELVGA